ncbi:MAG TPA: hypothetical protein VHY37_07950, partial [Tepidisphaeraceae bacterium]|nr:hypothetical protein [Tepidisphaeraceae bacterium]
TTDATTGCVDGAAAMIGGGAGAAVGGALAQPAAKTSPASEQAFRSCFRTRGVAPCSLPLSALSGGGPG